MPDDLGRLGDWLRLRARMGFKLAWSAGILHFSLQRQLLARPS